MSRLLLFGCFTIGPLLFYSSTVEHTKLKQFYCLLHNRKLFHFNKFLRPDTLKGKTILKVIIKDSKREYDGFFKVDKVVLQHEKFDGSMSKDIDRLNFNRRDTVAVILYNKINNSVVLIRQFRYPAYVDGGSGWLIECVAGIKDNGEVLVAKKEVLEETGYKVEELKYLTRFYPSPGGCSEIISIYLAYVETKEEIEGKYFGTGNEDIQVIEIPLAKALEMTKNGEICDGKTIIALFHLRNELEKG